MAATTEPKPRVVEFDVVDTCTPRHVQILSFLLGEERIYQIYKPANNKKWKSYGIPFTVGDMYDLYHNPLESKGTPMKEYKSIFPPEFQIE